MDHVQTATSLRSLYFSRTLVQLAWAGAITAAAPHNAGLTVLLLFLYPMWDVACTVYDAKTSSPAEPGIRTSQYLNIGLGAVAAVALALTARQNAQYAVVAFGVWAFVAGLLQLAVGAYRRKQLGGQWPMILSGLQSMAAGAGFTLGGLHDKFHVKDLGGYAIFGAAYFLIAAILLTRKISQLKTTGASVTL